MITQLQKKIYIKCYNKREDSTKIQRKDKQINILKQEIYYKNVKTYNKAFK